jgi:hypothetical protein
VTTRFDDDAHRDFRLRGAVARRGYRLRRSTSRDPQTAGHGLYFIIDPRTGQPHHGLIDGIPVLTLADVERWLAT